MASTQMNIESSRSHLIISVCIEATNLQTQNVTRGKLSFVDLAGSERWAPASLSLFSLCSHHGYEDHGRAERCDAHLEHVLPQYFFLLSQP